MKQSLGAKRRKVAQEIKDMLAALEEDFATQDELEEDLPESGMVEDKAKDETQPEVAADETSTCDVNVAEEGDEDDDDLDINIDLDLDDEDDEENEDAEEGEKNEAEATVASEVEKGIEDEIEDTGKGGDPTVKTVTPMGAKADKEVSSDKEVFPTKSQYVANVTKRLDKIASVLEAKGHSDLAYRIDKVSDYLEQNCK